MLLEEEAMRQIIAAMKSISALREAAQNTSRINCEGLSSSMACDYIHFIAAPSIGEIKCHVGLLVNLV